MRTGRMFIWRRRHNGLARDRRPPTQREWTYVQAVLEDVVLHKRTSDEHRQRGSVREVYSYQCMSAVSASQANDLTHPSERRGSPCRL